MGVKNPPSHLGAPRVLTSDSFAQGWLQTSPNMPVNKMGRWVWTLPGSTWQHPSC